MKEVVNHPYSKIISTLVLCVMLLAPFINFRECRNQIDDFTFIVYILVAIYLLTRKVISVWNG